MYLEVTDQTGQITKFPLSATSVITISEESDKAKQFSLTGITSVHIVDAPPSTVVAEPAPEDLDKPDDPKPFTTTSTTTNP